MNLKKPEDCTVEELLFDLTNCEDHDAVKLISAAGFNLEDGFAVMSYDGNFSNQGATLKDALINYGRAREKEFPTPEEYKEMDYTIIDWSS